MVYRPTVRYPDVYKDYIENLYKATELDRNQLMRLALFVAAHSEQYQSILKKHQLDDVPLPCPGWTLEEEGCWQEQYYRKKTEQRDLKFVEQGGIKIIFS